MTIKEHSKKKLDRLLKNTVNKTRQTTEEHSKTTRQTTDEHSKKTIQTTGKSTIENRWTAKKKE